MFFNAGAPRGYTFFPHRDGAGHQLARIWNAILAAGIWIGALGLQTYLSFTKAEGGGFTAVLITLSYFTILSNILVAIVATSLAIDPARDDAWFRWLRSTSLVMIFITGLVYVTVLAPLLTGDHALHGAAALANFCQHYFAPSMTVLGWLLLGPRPRITPGAIPMVLIIPAIWLAYTLFHGAADPGQFPDGESYPYPFLYVDTLGYPRVLMNIVAIAVFGIVMAAVFYGIDRLLCRRAAPPAAGVPTTASEPGSATVPGNA